MHACPSIDPQQATLGEMMSSHEREGKESAFRFIFREGPAWISALTAVATLVVGFIAGYGTRYAQVPAQSATAPAASPSIPQQSPSAVPSQNATPASDAHVRNSGQLTLNFNEEADLDSTQHNWDAPNPSVGADITVTTDSLTTTNSGASLAKLGNLPATYQGCMSTSDYIERQQGVPLSQISKNMNFCVKTDRGRFSLLHVTKVVSNPNQPDYIVFDVTTWEPVVNQ